MNKNKKIASFPAETNRDGILKKIIYWTIFQKSTKGTDAPGN